MKTKICHITSVHQRFDTRIFLKQCTSLSKNYEVHFVVADGKGDEQIQEIFIHDVGKPENRIKRMFNTTKLIQEKAISLSPEIVHIHDPELLLTTKAFQKQKIKVIFDAHEDFPKQLTSKPYLSSFVSQPLSVIMEIYEKFKFKKLDFLIAATPKIKEKLIKINPNTEVVNNYPILKELHTDDVNWDAKKNNICYIGGITKIRGILEVVEALNYCEREKPFLDLVGEFSEAETKKNAKSLDGYKYIIEHGFLNRQEVKSILSKARAGIVTFLPVPNHIEAQPNKMFEYMSASVPVIGSNFPLWREIIEGNKCGICVNPEDPKAIANAINYIFNNPTEAKRMGENGRKAIEQKYNWEIEEQKLIQLYNSILTK